MDTVTATANNDQGDPSASLLDPGPLHKATGNDPLKIEKEKDAHAHQDDHDEELCINCQESQVKSSEESQLPLKETETEEISLLQPKVKVNVHDPRVRAAADFMKTRHFGPGDVESVLHGGEEVHTHGRDDLPPIQAGDPETYTHGSHGVHSNEIGVSSTFDPEDAMHTGQDHAHDHHRMNDKQQQDIEPTFEKAVHGKDHIHDHQHNVDDDGMSNNAVKYQNIVDLGLSDEVLRGIDLSGLLKQEEREHEEWRRLSGIQPQDEPSSLRQQYLEKLAKRIRLLEPPDLETAEWDEGEGYDDVVHQGQRSDDEPHDGESMVEHEMEMWGSTAPKAGRKPHNVV